MKTIAALFLVFAAVTAAEEVNPQDEIRAYLEAVKRGEAGCSPELLTRARGGDREARRMVQARFLSNDLNRMLREGTITPEEAERRRADLARRHAEQRHAEAMERQRQAIEDLEHEVRRLRWETERNR